MASKAATKPAEVAQGDGSAQELAPVDFSKGGVLANMEDVVSGSSDFGQGDLSIPFLRIVQGLSPWIAPQDPKYVKGVCQGQIVETVTPRFWDGDEGLVVIPVLYQRNYTEWKPDRGGLVADYGTDSSILAKCKQVKNDDGKTKLITPDGNELAEAAMYFVMYAPYDESAPHCIGADFEQALLTMSGTQWKKSRDWNTNMSRVRLTRPDGSVIKNPLPFAMSYRLTTVAEKKDNYNFYGWKIQPHLFTLALGAELVHACAGFRKLASSGHVKGDDGGVAAEDGEHVPF